MAVPRRGVRTSWSAEDAGALRSALILASFEKPAVRDLAAELEPWLAERLERVEASRAVLLNPNATTPELLAAHATLRSVPGAYTPEMVARLVDLGAHATEARERADVWRQFDGATRLPALVDPLLSALRFDEHHDPREEAAETLAEYLDVPGVREALRFAGDNDPHEEVRRQARGSLKP